MNKEELKNLTPTEMRFKIENKKKAIADLSQNLSHLTKDPVESEFVKEDIRELNLEIAQLERHLGEVVNQKPFERSLNESWEY